MFHYYKKQQSVRECFVNETTRARYDCSWPYDPGMYRTPVRSDSHRRPRVGIVGRGLVGSQAICNEAKASAAVETAADER